MWPSIFAAMLLTSPGPTEIRVDVGKVELARLPALQRADRPLPTAEMAERVEQILASGKCRIAGQRSNRFDIDIPYAVLVEPDGRAYRVVVAEVGCPELESYAGLVVLELARLGDFKAIDGTKARWFGSILNFNLR